MTEQRTIAPPYMPNGNPAPFLMNIFELIDFLRIKTKHPRSSVDRMRKNGLRSVQVSRHVFFQLPDVLEFLRDEQGRSPR